MRTAWMAVVLAAAGCMPQGRYQGDGGQDPGYAQQPAPQGPDINGQWHAESTTDGQQGVGKASLWISAAGTFFTARLTPSAGGRELNLTGTIAADGSISCNYMVVAGGVNRQATMSGQIRSRSEITGRWTVPGYSTGTFRWVR